VLDRHGETKEGASRAVVRARPATHDDARGVLEWLARREGKSLPQLVEALRHHIGPGELV